MAFSYLTGLLWLLCLAECILMSWKCWFVPGVGWPEGPSYPVWPLWARQNWSKRCRQRGKMENSCRWCTWSSVVWEQTQNLSKVGHYVNSRQSEFLSSHNLFGFKRTSEALWDFFQIQITLQNSTLWWQHTVKLNVNKFFIGRKG